MPWKILRYLLLFTSATAAMPLLAEDRIELDTTTIKGNVELPKYLYVVPWQDKKANAGEEQKLVLHNLYSDLFDPVMPNYIAEGDYIAEPLGGQK